jgi:hypothetical protein
MLIFLGGSLTSGSLSISLPTCGVVPTLLMLLSKRRLGELGMPKAFGDAGTLLWSAGMACVVTIGAGRGLNPGDVLRCDELGELGGDDLEPFFGVEVEEGALVM